MKVLIMLYRGATMLVYLRSLGYRNFWMATHDAVKAGKNVIIDWALGAMYDELSAEFGSVTNRTGANTPWFLGRSGHTKLKKIWLIIPLSEASTVLLARLVNSGLEPRKSKISSSPSLRSDSWILTMTFSRTVFCRKVTRSRLSS